MSINWDQTELQRYINDKVEENLNLDYKSADALGASDGKKEEITKDVSSMSNSAGGTIIYGIKEYDEDDKKHLPENLTPIDRTQFSKEWLEQVINTIQPKVTGIIIHPVKLDTNPNHVAYVVEIPQSDTAHQARDFRYYRRYNFESVPMNDYEVRDVMHRASLPDVDVEFTPIESYSGFDREYSLNIAVRNQGDQVAERYKLHFTFPNFGNQMTMRDTFAPGDLYFEHYVVERNPDDSEYTIMFRSKYALFPKDGISLTDLISLRYIIDTRLHHRLMERKNARNEITVKWVLYADNMIPKSGEIPFSHLYKAS